MISYNVKYQFIGTQEELKPFRELFPIYIGLEGCYTDYLTYNDIVSLWRSKQDPSDLLSLIGGLLGEY